MELDALLQDVEIISRNFNDVTITNVTHDSEKIRQGGLFVCIKGRRSDGHLLAEKAVENGAYAIVCERSTGCENEILVKDSAKAYAIICANFYSNAHKKMHMIGITGTNGKTTTSYILKQILDDSGRKTGLIGTVNVIIGDEKFPTDLTTPDPNDLHRYLKMMFDKGCDTCIMEVSSQALIQKRVYGITFDCGVFTNLTREHLDYHKTMQEYANAKSELFRQSRISVINCDSDFADVMKSTATGRIVTYSSVEKSDYLAENVADCADGVKYTLKTADTLNEVQTKLIGRFSVYNSMAAIATANCIGVDIESAVKSVSGFNGITGRMEKIENPFGISIIIDFAHTPDSLENALKTLKNIKHNRLITVFGCGGDRDKTKRPIMGKTAQKYSDTVYITSDNPRTENPDSIISDIVSQLDRQSVFCITDRTTAIRSALNSAKKDDIILIAGKGHEKYQIIGNQKIHYDEREIIQKLIDDKARF